MSRIVNLSYELSLESPTFGGEKNFSLESARSIDCGHSSNSFFVRFHNHVGTHIDLPRHFSAQGKTLSDYSLQDFLFTTPHWQALPAKPNEMISTQTLEKLSLPPDVDFLMFKTHFSAHRNEKIFWSENPGFEPECADFLRTRCPRLRAIGFDFISLTAFQNREVGRVAHQKFLGHPERPIWIVEDMNLEPLTRKLQQVLISPLLIRNADGVPVTVWGFEND